MAIRRPHITIAIAFASIANVGVLAAASEQVGATERSTPPMQLKFKPSCDSDEHGPLVQEVSRLDRTVTFEVRVAASGKVEAIDPTDYQPHNDSMQRLANRFAKCWLKAVYDTAGIDVSLFPVSRKLTVVWEAR